MPASNRDEIDELKLDLKEAKDDLEDAKKRIKKIEETLWGKDPQGMTPDPDAMINILRDIRGKMPDLNTIAEDAKWAKRTIQIVFGSGGLFAIIAMVWQFKKMFV